MAIEIERPEEIPQKEGIERKEQEDKDSGRGEFVLKEKTVRMTKAPFSVEWLSQSSQGTYEPQQRPSSYAEAAAPAAAKRAWSAAESGSDWESGRSECQSPEEPGARGSRRLRTAFSVEQISTLESSFKRHKYLGSAERRKLAAKMQLSEVQIKTWFQNRRMKLKRQLQELRPEPFYSPVPFAARGGTLPLDSG
ncbi:Homeobox protein vent1B [Chelonia mydas]|uniref:Homeobox protein vent1B n=1 Tax=Chelonia mydas TaxID=8469 RepID=M7BY55_CHEMY|nr:Homeobox protein vent1B [Chelonia mydas]